MAMNAVRIQVRRNALDLSEFTVAQMQHITGLNPISIRTELGRMKKKGYLSSAPIQKEEKGRGAPPHKYQLTQDREKLEALLMEVEEFYAPQEETRDAPTGLHYQEALILIEELENDPLEGNLQEGKLAEAKAHVESAYADEGIGVLNNIDTEVLRAHLLLLEARIALLEEDHRRAEELIRHSKKSFSEYQIDSGIEQAETLFAKLSIEQTLADSSSLFEAQDKLIDLLRNKQVALPLSYVSNILSALRQKWEVTLDLGAESQQSDVLSEFELVFDEGEKIDSKPPTPTLSALITANTLIATTTLSDLARGWLESNRSGLQIATSHGLARSWTDAMYDAVWNHFLGEMQTSQGPSRLISTLSYSLLNISNLFLRQGRPDDAENYLKRALELSARTNDNIGVGFSLYSLGIAARGQGRLDVSLNYLRKSLEILSSIYQESDIILEEVLAAEILDLTGYSTPESLLELGSTPSGRRALAQKTGLGAEQIQFWVKHADLKRIDGLGEKYAKLLILVGVDTVPELAKRNPTKLYELCLQYNADKAVVRRAPSATRIENWIGQARQLPRKVFYTEQRHPELEPSFIE